ncbi:hypothetical protein PATSB16_30770 [Pandoraea thiooxydans]|nr:hypothetical protein PATSB16_30770 [Pandoraea thiooxydans]
MTRSGDFTDSWYRSCGKTGIDAHCRPAEARHDGIERHSRAFSVAWGGAA